MDETQITNIYGKREIPLFVIEDFKRSGISEDTIQKYIDGDYLKGSKDYWILYYPSLQYDLKTAYYIKRLKHPITSKYIKQKGQTSRIFRPINLKPETIFDTNEYLIITEGDKKAIKAVQEGFNCISIGGIWSWKCKPENLDEESESISEQADIIPDLKNANFEGKTIYLCYDNDMWYKPQVKEALYKFAAYLIAEKSAKVYTIILPRGNAKGLDDFLIWHNKKAFQELIDEAQEIDLKQIQAILSSNKTDKNHYPSDIFPENIENLILDLHERMDAPYEYLASSFVAGASTLLDGRASIIVDELKGWIDYPILWTLIIGNPSQKKTPCLNLIKSILDKYDEKLSKEFEHAKQEYKKKLAEYKMEIKEFERNNSKNGSNIDNITIPVEPEKLYKQRIMTQNTTVEALVRMSSNNQKRGSKRGISIIVDESVTFFKGLGQYKRNGDADEGYYLQAWKKQSYNIVRQGGEVDLTVKASHNILGSIQPKVLRRTLFSNGIESYNGMIERWLFVCSSYNETGLSYTGQNPYNISLIEEIYDTLFNLPETVYSFSTAAQKIFNEFCYKIVQRKKSGKLNDLMKNYIQKQTDYVARFSLILHCIDTPGIKEISVKTVENAIKLSGYFVACFEKTVLKELSSNALEEHTLNYLHIKELTKISPSRLYKSNMSKYKNVEYARNVLENLANKGFGRLVKLQNGSTFFIFYAS